jgi:hypothetical protein
VQLWLENRRMNIVILQSIRYAAVQIAHNIGTSLYWIHIRDELVAYSRLISRRYSRLINLQTATFTHIELNIVVLQFVVVLQTKPITTLIHIYICSILESGCQTKDGYIPQISGTYPSPSG